MLPAELCLTIPPTPVKFDPLGGLIPVPRGLADRLAPSFEDKKQTGATRRLKSKP
jgi:hypothetical protein